MKIRLIIELLILTFFALLGLLFVFLENYQDLSGAMFSTTGVCFLLGKKLGDKYYTIKKQRFL